MIIAPFLPDIGNIRRMAQTGLDRDQNREGTTVMAR